MRSSLDLIEDAIEIDPHHRWRRIEIDGIVYDRTEHGMMVAYSMEALPNAPRVPVEWR